MTTSTTSAGTTEATTLDTPLLSRLSLEPACGLSVLPTDPEGSNTLISCLTHMSPCTFPYPTVAINGDGHTIKTHTTSDCKFTPRGTNGTNGALKKRFPQAPPPRPTSELGTREEQRRIYLGPKLSDRATGGPDAGPLIERFSCLFKNQYHCKTNRCGIISLGVAENFLLEKECLEYFTKAFADNFLASDLSYGDSLWGSRRINRALASFFNDWFEPAEEVQPEQLITGVGCSAVLDQLFFTLVDEDEAVLLAGPYYTGFDRDLIGRARVRLVPVELPEGDGAFDPSTLAAFEDKMDELAAEGVRVRAVILCNPHNPLGRTYPRETLLEYARFCEERDLHLVSDEIYAMSVYENTAFPHALPFTSMLSLDVERELGIPFDRARLHVVYGMSKDFCANGLRVGALVSQANPLLLRAMASTSMLMKISSPSDVIWSALLSDRERLAEFIGLNRSRLAEAAQFVREWFEARGVIVAHSNAGNFVWVDLGGRLGFRSECEEKRIFQLLLDGGVYVAPGTAYHNPIPGWYRITFSVARDNLVVGLGKIEELLGLEASTADN